MLIESLKPWRAAVLCAARPVPDIIAQYLSSADAISQILRRDRWLFI